MVIHAVLSAVEMASVLKPGQIQSGVDQPQWNGAKMAACRVRGNEPKSEDCDDGNSADGSIATAGSGVR